LDLVGEVAQWNLDWYASYALCADCADTTAASGRVSRVGGFASPGGGLLPPIRNGVPPTDRESLGGFRCARTP